MSHMASSFPCLPFVLSELAGSTHNISVSSLECDPFAVGPRDSTIQHAFADHTAVTSALQALENVRCATFSTSCRVHLAFPFSALFAPCLSVFYHVPILVTNILGHLVCAGQWHSGRRALGGGEVGVQNPLQIREQPTRLMYLKYSSYTYSSRKAASGALQKR